LVVVVVVAWISTDVEHSLYTAEDLCLIVRKFLAILSALIAGGLANTLVR